MTFIDLDLPSGTLWAENSEQGYYTFKEAVKKFKNNLPTKEQFEELCTLPHHWDNKREGLEFIGNNGNKLFIPACGFEFEHGLFVDFIGLLGFYWSSILDDKGLAYYLYFSADPNDYSESISLSRSNRYGYSVRLIQNSK